MRALIPLLLAFNWSMTLADDAPKPPPAKPWTADSSKVTADSTTATTDGGTKSVKPKTTTADSAKVTADSMKATADGGAKPTPTKKAKAVTTDKPASTGQPAKQ